MKLAKLQKVLLLAALLSIAGNGFLLFYPWNAEAWTTTAYLVFLVNQTVTGAYTPSNLTLRVSINPSLYSAYEAADLGNIRFYYELTGAYFTDPLSSWLESYSGNTTSDLRTATNATFWVRYHNFPHPSSPGTWSGGLYLVFDPANGTFGTFTDVAGNMAMAGEAPQLSPTYGQYDSGSWVFLFYDNFNGTTLSTNWAANGASYSVNNGLTYNTNPDVNMLTSAINVTYDYWGAINYPVIDYYGHATSSTGDAGVYFNLQSTSSNSSGYLWAQGGSTLTDRFYNYTPPTYTQQASWTYSIDGANHVYSVMFGPSTSGNQTLALTDYALKENYTSMPLTYPNGYFGPRANAGTMFWQWVRMRPMPPAGVEPSISLDALVVRKAWTLDPEVMQEYVLNATSNAILGTGRTANYLINATANLVAGSGRFVNYLTNATNQGRLLSSRVLESFYSPNATVTVTVTTSPPLSASIVIDGVTYDPPHTFTWTMDSVHTIGAVSPLGSYKWQSWSDGGAQTHNVSTSTNIVITAYYVYTEAPPEGPPYQPPPPPPPPPPPAPGTNSTTTIPPGGSGSGTIVITPPGPGYQITDVQVDPSFPWVSFNGTLPMWITDNATLSFWATPPPSLAGLYKVPVTITMQDPSGATMTQKATLGFEITPEATGSYAQWFLWGLLLLLLLVLMESFRAKKK